MFLVQFIHMVHLKVPWLGANLNAEIEHELVTHQKLSSIPVLMKLR